MYSVSVVIPIYNSENFIKKTVDSVLKQSFIDFEIILVDNNSKDKSLSICKEFAKKDKRIKVLQEKRQGVSFARNLGIKNAKGKYITFIDSDDIIYKDFFDSAFNYCEDKNLDLCYLLNHNNGEEISNKFLKKCNTVNDFKNFFHKIRCIHGVFYKKEFLDKQKILFDTNIAISEDWLFNAACLFNSDKIGKLDTVAYKYIMREGSLFTTYDEKHLSKINAFDEIWQILKKNKCESKHRYLFLKSLSHSLRSSKKRLNPDLKNKYTENLYKMLEKNKISKLWFNIIHFYKEVLRFLLKIITIFLPVIVYVSDINVYLKFVLLAILTVYFYKRLGRLSRGKK